MKKLIMTLVISDGGEPCRHIYKLYNHGNRLIEQGQRRSDRVTGNILQFHLSGKPNCQLSGE